MRLVRVTLTGADDSIEPAHLVRRSAAYPFVEWGILIAPGREGKPRFASPEWRATLAALVESAPHPVALAAHLAGAASGAIFKGDAAFVRASENALFARIQLNGFSSHAKAPGTREVVAACPATGFILQVQHERAAAAAVVLAGSGLANVAALWDRSGGRGLAPEAWPAPIAGVSTGFAGGLGPENVAAAGAALKARPGDDPFWIDMESKVRTQDDASFDLERVDRVLAAMAPLVDA